jgi:hypothetical protein
MYVCMYVMHLMYACVDRIYCTYNITCMCRSHLMYTDIQIWCMYRMWCLCACMHVRMYHIWCMMYASQVHVCIVSNVCAYVCICLLKFTWVSIFMQHCVITAHGLPYAPSGLLLASGPWWSSGSPWLARSSEARRTIFAHWCAHGYWKHCGMAVQSWCARGVAKCRSQRGRR